MAKQSSLPGVELGSPSKRITELAETLGEVRRKRIKIHGDEADAQMLLLDEMEKAKITAFQMEDGRICSINELRKVKIAKPKADEDGEE